MMNEDSGNYILAADVGSDGQVNLHEVHATGGMGLHGINERDTGPDGLFGQGSVAPGSETVSLFSINPSDPSNLMLISDPAGSGGQWPTSVTFNKAGDSVCSGELRNLQSNKIIISFRKGRYQLGRWNREEVRE
ncbi:hypothetical protein C8J55DRAFT_557697 [Lentinula edodes]|uniref:Uncharacterized protein n=1 Tax=Lentinula lateritia TaxID=40482 RepID=A0A9W9AS85_9AGAR|nr:hypothetical protein C8J55DRAFT_557697 [Lentinula edodes]